MWQATPLVLEAKSGLVLGRRAVGMIQTTRLYVTSRQLWAAVTDRLTTVLFERPSATDFQTVGDFVETHLRFSYFYLWEQANGRLTPLYGEDGLCYGPLSEREVERRYVTTYVSTALDYPEHSAKDGSLHEIEYLASQRRADGEVCPTRLAGVVWHQAGESSLGTLRELRLTRDGQAIRLREDVFADLRLGGERTYGFGRVTPAEVLDWVCPPELKPCPDEELCLKLPEGRRCHLEAHVRYDSTLQTAYEGALEPVVGRSWDLDRGAGRRLTPLGVCLSPGTAVTPSAPMVLRPAGPEPWQMVPEP